MRSLHTSSQRCICIIDTFHILKSCLTVLNAEALIQYINIHIIPAALYVTNSVLDHCLIPVAAVAMDKGEFL